jgi:hypothetical protein
LYESNVKFYGYSNITDYSNVGGENIHISNYDGHIASSGEYYANKIAPDLAVFAQSYIDRKAAEIQNTITAINSAMRRANNETLTAGPGGQLLIAILAKIIPDRISLSLEGKVAVVL